MKNFRDKRTRQRFTSISTGDTIVVYDTETTGLFPGESEIVQFAGIKYQIQDGGEWKVLKELNLFIKPKNSIPPEVSAINHIFDETVQDCPTIEECFDEIAELLEADYWCGHNIIGFDNLFMECAYQDRLLPKGYYNSCDTLDASVDLVEHKDCVKYNLTSMSKFFGIEESQEGTAGFHDALFDVRQCAELAKTLAKAYQEEEIPVNTKYINPNITPKIYSVKYWEIPTKPGQKKPFTYGRKLYVETDCGKFSYDLYNQIWKGEPYRPVDWQKIVEAVYDFLGLQSDTQLIHWPKENTVKKA